MKKTIYIKFGNKNLIKYFSKKSLDKKDKNRIKNLNHIKDSFKISRTIKQSFRKKGHFSISHKNDMAIVAFSKHHGFGIDLEYLHVRNFDAIIDFCFNKDEKEIFTKSNDKIITFYKFFTAKEALIKAKHLDFSFLAKVGFDKNKNAFIDENGKKYNVAFNFIKNNYIFCICFKDKRDIILKI